MSPQENPFALQPLEYTSDASLAAQGELLETHYLRHDVTHDFTTDLLNERGFAIELEQLMKKSEAVAIAVIDLDAFKSINDALGHLTGNQVLKSVAPLAAAFSEKFRRSTDIKAVFSRSGGDEFTVAVGFFDISSIGEEYLSFTRYLQEFGDEFIESNEEAVNLGTGVGTSIGTALGVRGTGVTVEDLIKEADERMYAQKKLNHQRRGANRNIRN